MVKNGYVHLLGSDAHNNKKRNFCLGHAYTMLRDNISEDSLEILKLNSENFPILPILKN